MKRKGHKITMLEDPKDKRRVMKCILYVSPTGATCKYQRKWVHKIGKLLEPPTRNIPRLHV